MRSADPSPPLRKKEEEFEQTCAASRYARERIWAGRKSVKKRKKSSKHESRTGGAGDRAGVGCRFRGRKSAVDSERDSGAEDECRWRAGRPYLRSSAEF